MKWELSLPESPMLLYYSAKLTGLAPFTVIENRFYPPTILSKLYTIGLAVGYCVVVLIACTAAESSSNAIERYHLALLNNWASLHNIFGFASVTSALIIFLANYKTIVYLLNKLCCINDELTRMNVGEAREKFFKNIYNAVLWANVGLAAAHIVIRYIDSDLYLPMAIKRSFDEWLTFNVVFIFAGIMIYIKQSFELSNQNFIDAFQSTDRVSNLPQHLRLFVPNGNPREENDENHTNLRIIRTIKRLHLELCDLTDQLIDLFSIPIGFKIIYCCSVLITRSFWIYFVAMNSNQPRNNFVEIILFIVHNILSCLLRIIISFIELIIVAHASTITCKQGNATRAALSKVWDTFQPRELKDELRMFSTQLLHTPVSMSIFGFFDLNYSLIYEVFGSVLVYLIVTIQFDVGPRDSGESPMHSTLFYSN